MMRLKIWRELERQQETLEEVQEEIFQEILTFQKNSVLDYLKEINFECVVLGTVIWYVELSDNPKGFVHNGCN